VPDYFFLPPFLALRAVALPEFCLAFCFAVAVFFFLFLDLTISQCGFVSMVALATLCMGAKRHGHSLNGVRSLTHSTWHNMRSRCNNPNLKAYTNYGAKGIKVCERWNIFENFLQDMGERPGPEYSIERIDYTKDY